MEIKHGTYYGYHNQLCRCDECREASRVYHREQRAGLKRRQEPDHGSLAMFNRGCRCDPCRLKRNEYLREYAARSPEYRDRKHKNEIKSKYGITAEEFQGLMDQQDGSCAICKEPESHNSRQRLSVDHNHTTNAVRGLLCNDCNRGLGFYKDDPELLLAAYKYLINSI